MTTIIVCGGRTYNERTTVFDTLDALHKDKPITLLLFGGAPGADALARDWAAKHEVEALMFPANWTKHGKAAGPKRNQEMADHGANLCVAFPGGRGTADMVHRATAAGIMVALIP